MLQGGAPPPPRGSPVSQRPSQNAANDARHEAPASRSLSPGVRTAGQRSRPVAGSPGSGLSAVASRASPPPRAASAPGGAASRQVTNSSADGPQQGGGLCRVQSEKTLGKSPRRRKDSSRSPSPGTGRGSPSALLPPRGAGSRATPLDRRAPRQGEGRTLSPSQSEGSLPTAQRMVSAPSDSHRSVAVRTKQGTSNSARVGTGYGTGSRTSGTAALQETE